jgi:hypothetical protein
MSNLNSQSNQAPKASISTPATVASTPPPPSANREPVKGVYDGATDRLALFSLILGIVAFFSAGIAGIVGIVLGGMALLRIRDGRATGKRMAWIGISLSVLAIILSIIAGLILHSVVTDNAAHDRQVTANHKVAVARSTVAADVKATTANVKAYLQKNPDATIDEMIINSKQVNQRADKGETIVIANVSSSAKTGYQNWTVIGTDEALNPNSHYNYQSYSNTFRWLDNKTGASSQVTSDKTPRNKGAINAG